MSSQKIVEVLCLNGRRHKIKTSSSSSVLQVLKEACQKYGYNDPEIDLMHKRKVLDVTVTVGHANIPNNGKLEMVKRNIPRKASQVQVALQTEFSERLQHSFDPSCTLFDVLSYWNGEPGSCYHGKVICKTPVIVYMTKQICGSRNLRSTTLEKLGLISGRAAMRLTHKNEEDDSLNEIPKVVNSEQNIEELSKTMNYEDSPTEVVARPSDNTNVLQDSVNPTQTSFHSIDHKEKESIETREPKEKKQKLTETHSPEKSLEEVSTQNPVTTNAGDTSSQLYNDFKFPDYTEEQNRFLNEVQPIDPKEIMKEVKLSMPCARNAIVFNYDQNQPSSSEYEEPSDEFFDVTLNELRKMMIEKSQKIEDEPMMTKAMREAKEKEKMLKYEKVIVRILFPDKFALQGIFRPLEEVGTVKEFVRQHLADENTKFELYTTPPKCILKNLKQSLDSAKLVPSAIIRVSGETKSESWLKQNFIDGAATYKEAEVAVSNALQRYVDSQTQESSTGLVSNTSTETDTGNKSTLKDVATGSSSSNASKTKQSEGKVPKWFKQGKK